MSSTDMLKTIGWETLKTSSSIFAVNMAGVPELIRSTVPGRSNKAVGYLADGAVYSVARDVVTYLTDRKSNIADMNYLGIADDIAFFGIVSAVSNEARLIDQTFNILDKTLPLGSEIVANVAEGLIIAGSSLLADGLDIGTGNNLAFDFVRRPVSTLVNQVNRA